MFPDSLLKSVGDFEHQESYRALNCALITWKTNRNISNKSPIDYLYDRVKAAHLGEEAIRTRLHSHLVPYEALVTAGPYVTGDKDNVRTDYKAFLQKRAEVMLPAVHALCFGRDVRTSY